MTTQCETKTTLCYILIKLVDLMSDRWSKMVFVLICCETDTVVGGEVGGVHILLVQRVQVSREFGSNNRDYSLEGSCIITGTVNCMRVYLHTLVICVRSVTVRRRIFTLGTTMPTIKTVSHSTLHRRCY
jgi:hypothetical protein